MMSIIKAFILSACILMMWLKPALHQKCSTVSFLSHLSHWCLAWSSAVLQEPVGSDGVNSFISCWGDGSITKAVRADTCPVVRHKGHKLSDHTHCRLGSQALCAAWAGRGVGVAVTAWQYSF